MEIPDHGPATGRRVLLVIIACGVLGSLGLAWVALPRLTHETEYPFFIAAAAVFGVVIAGWAVWPRRRERLVAVAEASALALVALASLAGIELVARSLMSDLPRAVQDKFQFESPFEQRVDTVEMLDHSPWIKFRPAVCVNRGDPPHSDGFQSEFCTDQRGFKNRPGVLERGNVRLVVAGDSFTEGMGVPVDEVWASLLSDRGLTTYSVGVQGYATEMALGALQRYGLDLKPEYVLYGCTLCMTANNAYRDPGTGRLMGNMINVMRNELRRRGRVRYSLAVSAMAHAGIEALRYRFNLPLGALFTPVTGSKRLADWLAALRDPVRDDARQARIEADRLARAIDIPAQAPALIARYENEIRHYAAARLPEKEREAAWKSVREDLLEMQRLSAAAGARFGIVLFPHRGVIYYDTFVGRFPEASLFVANRRVITEFAGEHGILLVDLHEPVAALLRSLGPGAPLEQYPYLGEDGHMNAVGQRLVADAVQRAVLAQDGGPSASR